MNRAPAWWPWPNDRRDPAAVWARNLDYSLTYSAMLRPTVFLITKP